MWFLGSAGNSNCHVKEASIGLTEAVHLGLFLPRVDRTGHMAQVRPRFRISGCVWRDGGASTSHIHLHKWQGTSSEEKLTIRQEGARPDTPDLITMTQLWLNTWHIPALCTLLPSSLGTNLASSSWASLKMQPPNLTVTSTLHRLSFGPTWSSQVQDIGNLGN